MQVIHGPVRKFKFVHGGDEECDDLGDELAGVALVILDRYWPVFSDSLFQISSLLKKRVCLCVLALMFGSSIK